MLFFWSACYVCVSLTNLWAHGAPVPVEMVDMSYVFNNDTLHWPTIEKFNIVVKRNGSDRGFWVQSESYFSGIHVGTHMDAPCHFSKGGTCVDKIPLDHLIAPAAVIDIIEKAKQDRDYLVQVEDLQNWERQTDRSLNSTIVLLKSGWGRRWGNREAFTGTPGYDPTQLHFPGMSQTASQWLVDNRKIYGIGTECLSFDHGPTQQMMAHRILLGNEIYALENVANMEEIPEYGATLYVMPMKVDNGSGAPVRIIATFPKTLLSQQQANINKKREL